MYKVANDMSTDIMNEVFKLRNTPHYNLRHTSTAFFYRPNPWCL